MDKKIVEVNGTKIEIDFSGGKRIETFKVGDNVKVFKKKYGGEYKVNPGIITGFASSNDIAAIEVTYLDVTYNECKIEVAYITEKTEDVFIAGFSTTDNYMSHEKVNDMLNREIQRKTFELEEAKSKLRFFNDFYGTMVSQNQQEGEHNGK